MDRASDLCDMDRLIWPYCMVAKAAAMLCGSFQQTASMTSWLGYGFIFATAQWQCAGLEIKEFHKEINRFCAVPTQNVISYSSDQLLWEIIVSGHSMLQRSLDSGKNEIQLVEVEAIIIQLLSHTPGLSFLSLKTIQPTVGLPIAEDPWNTSFHIKGIIRTPHGEPNTPCLPQCSEHIHSLNNCQLVWAECHPQ